MRCFGTTLFSLLALAASARADLVVLRPGAEGQDSSPYEFLPALARGNHTSLYAFSDPETAHGFETYLRFDLPVDLLAPDETVAQALLFVFYGIDSTVFGETSDEPGALECREVLEPWDETNLTWASRPAYGPVLDSVVGIEALGSLLCDVTGVVADHVDGVRANHGFALTNPTLRLLGFYSYEADVAANLKPALFITREVVPEPTPAAVAALCALALLARKGRA
jgi:hypothetical protein